MGAAPSDYRLPVVYIKRGAILLATTVICVVDYEDKEGG